MRGKPKGIRRKDAKTLANMSEKYSLSQWGEISKWPGELSIFEDFHLLRWLLDQDEETQKLYCAEGELEEWRSHADDRARGVMIDAVLKNDAEFFERMAAIARFRRESAGPVDKLGFHVLLAFRGLELEKKRISAAAVADSLAKRFPRDDGQAYDERDIRRVMRELGLNKRKTHN